MSVLNLLVRRHPGYSEPVKSKEDVVVHCGFRRFRASPLYSQHTSGVSSTPPRGGEVPAGSSLKEGDGNPCGVFSFLMTFGLRRVGDGQKGQAGLGEMPSFGGGSLRSLNQTRGLNRPRLQGIGRPASEWLKSSSECREMRRCISSFLSPFGPVHLGERFKSCDV